MLSLVAASSSSVVRRNGVGVLTSSRCITSSSRQAIVNASSSVLLVENQQIIQSRKQKQQLQQQHSTTKNNNIQQQCRRTMMAHSSFSEPVVKKSLITGNESVHSTMKVSKNYRMKPLFRRQGDVRFKTGMEAAQLLVNEAQRRDGHEKEFISAISANIHCLSPIFERNPTYAFIAKSLMEPDRHIQFRVAWTDDTGVMRMNRGYRIQYNNSIGSYAGPIHFGPHVTNSVLKSLGFDSLFSNSLVGNTGTSGIGVGAAVGGADFNPLDKSLGELQRFCQSYMTELSKYIEPGVDTPYMGMGCGAEEMGYLFGHYKRINPKACNSSLFLSGAYPGATGIGVVHFANEMLKDKNDTLVGKRCLIIGSGKVARSVAEKLLDFGAIPITFSDMSGHVYEPDGITSGKLKVIQKIKGERGNLLGRYIISSTTAEFNNPQNIVDIPCDLCFPCGAMYDIDDIDVGRLADNGCMGIIEGGHSTVTALARTCLKKRSMLYGPHTMTLTGNAILQSLSSGTNTSNMSSSLSEQSLDTILADHAAYIYKDVKRTASEFNVRGDLFAGANIMGFLRVANIMVTHGAV